MSYLSRLLHASPPLLLFDPELAARKNALFQAAAHGTGSDVAMLLSLSFAVGDAHVSYENENEEDESVEDDIRTFDVNEKDSQGPLLAAVGAGKFELAERLVRKGADVNVINGDGASSRQCSDTELGPSHPFALD